MFSLWFLRCKEVYGQRKRSANQNCCPFYLSPSLPAVKWLLGGLGLYSFQTFESLRSLHFLPVPTLTKARNGVELGMYRHPDIATENRLGIRNVRIEKLTDWPVVKPR